MFCRNYFALMLVSCLVLLPAGIDSRSIRRRAMKTTPWRSQKEPCEQQQPLRQYRNRSGGCSVCTSCAKLGLLTKQGCSDYGDEICHNICLDSDAEYDDVVGICTKKQQLKSANTQSPKRPVATELVTTSPQLIARPSSAAPSDSSPVSFQSKPTPGSFRQNDVKVDTLIIAMISVFVVFLLCLIVCLIVYLPCKNRRKDKTVYKECPVTRSNATHQQDDTAGSDEALLPDTSEKKDTDKIHSAPASRLQDQRVDVAYKTFEEKNKDMQQGEQASDTYDCIDESMMNKN